MQELCGWQDNPGEVQRIWEKMPTPFFAAPSPDQGHDQHNHLIFKQFTGNWAPEGPQLIGDCVSWGNGRLVNYTNVLEAWLQIQQAKLAGASDADIKSMEDAYEYQESCTEAIYGLSRVEVGGQHGSYEDGSVGAWAAKALVTYGCFSRKNLDQLGKSGAYDPNRAKDWGANGLSPDLETLARQHPFGDTTPVNNFNDAAWHIQNYRVVAVCSNVGFENGPGRVTQRDSTGRATPRGVWPHCMTFVSVRWNPHPQLLLCNQWPKGSTIGPKGDVDIPDCSWWVDAEVCDRMLGQRDSFTGSKYKGYPARRLTWRF